MRPEYAEICKDLLAKPVGKHVIIKHKSNRPSEINKMCLHFQSREDAEAWILERFDSYYDYKNNKRSVDD